MVVPQFNTDCLPDVLPLYYKRLFPFDSYFKWLSYGSKEYFSRREFSMTYNGDIFVRYQSFENQEELMDLICRKVPSKIDIGAIFSGKPKLHRQVDNFEAVEKELVIDIDMTDYDEVRTCCKDAAICQKCWKFMIVACKVIDASLREDFGLNNLLWVFSGRRGVHCWACDEKARKYSTTSRTSLAEYLNVITGGDQKKKKVKIFGDHLHSSISRSYQIAEPYFKEICLIDQDILGTRERVIEFIKLTSNLDDARLEQELMKLQTSELRWEKFLDIYKETTQGSGTFNKKHQFLVEEIILQYLYPRIDINVTKGLNHLLKSPFCIHPKTGNVCIPFTASNVDKFNPLNVPTIDILIEEINSFDEKVKKENPEQSIGTPTVLPRIKDYKKTSLYKGIVVFENFVRTLDPLSTASLEF